MIVTAILATPVLLLIGFGSMLCGTVTTPVFQHISSSEIVVKRSLGCGAWDSDFPVYKYYKVIPATPLFWIVTPFDTAKLDRTIWLTYFPPPPSNRTNEEIIWEKAALEKAAREKVKKEENKK